MLRNKKQKQELDSYFLNLLNHFQKFGKRKGGLSHPKDFWEKMKEIIKEIHEFKSTYTDTKKSADWK